MDDRNSQCSSTSSSFMLVVIGNFNCQLLLLLIIAQHAENALHKAQGPRKRFGSGKVGSQTSMQQLQGLLPGQNLRQGRHLWGWSGILRGLHVGFSFCSHAYGTVSPLACHIMEKSA